MSMSTHVAGYRPADDEWKKMEKVWRACAEAGVETPQEVYDFFDGENPTGKPGIEVDLGDAAAEWTGDGRDGYLVDVRKLPEGLNFIRFWNSY